MNTARPEATLCDFKTATNAAHAAVTTFAGRPLCIAPGVASTLNLPFEGSGVLNEGQPPGIAFHLIGDDNRIVTHFRAVIN